MNILFMGTPDFAVESLKALISSNHTVCGVVSQPDKPKGRGHKMSMPDVKVEALKNDIPVYQPNTLKNGELHEVLDEKKPDLIVVAAYGKILPNYVIDYPRYGCINVHGSLLPKYRGAAPIQRAVLDGEKVTGITTMQMDYGLDTGDILLTSEIEIGENETSEQLFDRMAKAGGELLLKTLDQVENGNISPKKQGDNFTYASMISKDEAQISWCESSQCVHNLIRGMYSWPVAYSYYNGESVKLIGSVMCDGNGEPGKILRIEKGRGVVIACGSGAVCVSEIQFAGSKRMSVDNYVCGHSLPIGTKFGKE